MLPSTRVPSDGNTKRGRGRRARLVVDQYELSAPPACFEMPRRSLCSHCSALKAPLKSPPSWAPMPCGLVSAFIRPPARRLTRDVHTGRGSQPFLFLMRSCYAPSNKWSNATASFSTINSMQPLPSPPVPSSHVPSHPLPSPPLPSRYPCDTALHRMTGR